MSERSTRPSFARSEAGHTFLLDRFSATNDALCERHLLFAVVVALATAARRTVEGLLPAQYGMS